MANQEITFFDMTATYDSPEMIGAGSTYEAADGNVYIFLQVLEGVTLGDLVTPTAGTGIVRDSDITTGSAIGSQTLTSTGSFTTAILSGTTAIKHSDVAGSGPGGSLCYFFIDVTPGVGQTGIIRRRIDDDSADAITLTNLNVGTDGDLAVALTTTSDIQLFNFFRVEEADAATERPIGIAIATVAADDWAWFLFKGSGFVQWNAGSALQANGVLMPSATAGKADGTTGTQTTLEATCSFGFAWTRTDVITDCLMPGNFNFEVLWASGKIAMPVNPNLTYPAGQYNRR